MIVLKIKKVIPKQMRIQTKQVLKILKEGFPNEKNIHKALELECIWYYLYLNDLIIGVCCVSNEELCNLAIKKEFRNKGYGTYFLSKVLSFYDKLIIYDTRGGNFYKRLGFD